VKLHSMLLAATVAFAPATALAKSARPADVTAEMSKLTEGCKAVKELPGFETIVDLNGDGAKDYVLDYEHAECDGSSTFFCGSAGCQMQVFLSKGAHYVEVNGLAAREHKLVKKNGRYVMHVTEHGSYCGHAGADECNSTYRFVGSKMRRSR
jgi:hypothetical protein